MIDFEGYKFYLSNKGNSLGDVRRRQSEGVISYTFKNDPNYKRVYILAEDGWKYEDVKYQLHTTESISKDSVDYYIQFRPGVHYPIGSYVIIPDDTSPEINLTDEELGNPFLQPVNKRTQWWLIVGRNRVNTFVRYSVLQCNWNFKWIYDNKIQECFGCMRSANSYTAGVYEGTYVDILDNLTSAWLPDTYYTYGDGLEDLGLSDTRTIFYLTRFLLSNNILEPKVYQVTKIVDLSPPGIIKLSIQQTQFDAKRDNLDLMVCNYYGDNGETEIVSEKNPSPDETLVGAIIPLSVNENGELVEIQAPSPMLIGKESYFKVKFSIQGTEVFDVTPIWEIKLDADNPDASYYEGLIKISQLEDNTISLKPGKVKSLIGKHFILSVSDDEGEYYSSIELEVGGYAT